MKQRILPDILYIVNGVIYQTRAALAESKKQAKAAEEAATTKKATAEGTTETIAVEADVDTNVNNDTTVAASEKPQKKRPLEDAGDGEDSSPKKKPAPNDT